MFRRNETRTRGDQLRAELGQSWDHALRAAGHAAGGVRAAVGPRVAPAAERVRGVAASRWQSTKLALAPLTEAAREPQNGNRRRGGGTNRRRRRWPAVAGLVAGGAAVGGVTAFLLRRRRQQQQQWEDYQHSEPAATGSPGTAEAHRPAAGTPAASAPAAPPGGAAAGGTTGGGTGPAGTGTVSADPVPNAKRSTEPVSGRTSTSGPVSTAGTAGSGPVGTTGSTSGTDRDGPGRVSGPAPVGTGRNDRTESNSSRA